MSDEVDFLYADKHESFPQFDTMIFDGGGQEVPEVPKIASLQSLYSISKKKLRDENDFLHADKHKSFLQADFSTLGIKVFCKLILS